MKTPAPIWTLTIDETWIAWLVIDRSDASVNTLCAQALEELSAHLDALEADERIRAVAIRSGKTRGFIAGADIAELARIVDPTDALLKSEAGHTVFARLAALPVPTVAVIHGACLGGGLELALACDYRLISDDPATKLGLPEVNLGIIPGWGGTQRLPRLVGLPAALTMISSGRGQSSRGARRMGLADGVVTAAFLEERTRGFVDRILTSRGRRAIERRRLRARPRGMRLLERLPFGPRIICTIARRQILAKTKGLYPAPLAALDVLRRTTRRRLDDGLRIEAEAFSRLACSPISRNLVWLYQANQRVKKQAAGTTEAPLRSTAVVGAGIMGGGIAWGLSHAGLPVRMKDLNWPAVASGLGAARSMFDAMVKRRRMTPADRDMAMHRISGTLTYSGFSRADVVIEAVVEDIAVKTRVLAEIEAHVSSEAIICTNTSSLALSDLAGALEHPKRFAGLHFFNPVNRMQLVEIVAGKKTSRRTIATLVDLVRRMDKLPIVVADCPGFLVNRILLPYLMESAWMFEEGIPFERIDAALERFGMPMGPFALVDEVGVDVGFKVAKILEAAYGDRMHVAGVLAEVAADPERCGRKSGRGFYVYDGKDGRTARRVNDAVVHLPDAARRADGVARQDLTEDDIVDRAVLIMVNEAARCLDEQIVGDPEMLDMAMVMGTGFAPFRGGLLRYADERGVATIRDRLNELAVQYGDRFRPAPLIERIAGNGNHFHHES